MDKRILSTAAVLAVMAIILGAFGAHKLKSLLSIESLQAFETGVRYQMYHAFLLLFLGCFNKFSIKSKKLLYNLTCIGVLLFSGSIYLLSTQKIIGIDFSSIGFLTPIGGVVLIVTWLCLLRNFLKLSNS